MISQERVLLTGGTLPQKRVLPPRGRHLDLGLTSIAIKSLTQVGEVMNHAGMFLVPLIMIVPDAATFVLLNEPAKRQDGWASLQEENPRVGIEPRDLEIHHVRGGSGAVRSGHTDHSSVKPNGFAKLVRKALVTSKMIS